MTGNDSVPRNSGVVPLRTILRNFLNLVESCENGIDDLESIYETEFQELKQFSETLKTDPGYACKEGEKTVNRKKNRYKDILPFDYTRVTLGDYGDVPGSDYINANFIKGASGSSAYIACQGPLPHTVNDFWRMVVECEVQVIVMACNEQESGKHKCENYWVEEEGMEREFGQVKVWLKKCRQVCPDFLVRTMRISYTSPKGEAEERNVCQFHYSAWPDHGVPTRVRPLLDMVRLIRDCQTSETLPVLVHCSAGCGRTGTICAIDYVWGLLRLGKLSADFSLFNLVREMRRQRIAMVQTKDQYIMVHRAVKELFEEQLKIIDSHPYANVDSNGFSMDIKSDLEEHTYETIEFRSDPNVDKCQNSTFVSHISPSFDSSGSSHKSKRDMQPSSTSHIQQPWVDDITVLSSEDEEKEGKEKKSIRSSILRKPNMGKIKSFFDKAKEGKKAGATKLSRAKSDVSARFYNIASSFQSRDNQQKSPTPSLDTTPKQKLKPPLLAKPFFPIKRSKSLKVGKEEEGSPIGNHKMVANNNSAFNKSLLGPSSSSSFTSATARCSTTPQTTNEAAEVSMKAKELASKYSASTSSSLHSQKQEKTKPALPPKSSWLFKSTSQGGKNRVVKEMEDALDSGREASKYDKLKKYDTVVVKCTSGKRSSLTRSQSNVWQPSPVHTPFRIFSDDLPHKMDSDVPTIPAENICHTRKFGSWDTACSNVPSSGVNITMETCNREEPEQLKDDKPIVRRRVPKTNQYANYTPGLLGSSTPPKRSSPTTARICVNESRTPRDLPILKPGYSRSRENSSESSSNNATPRSSLPSTPTQTIDSTYAQIMKTNMQALITSKNIGRTKGPGPPKPIVKDSLSSTPSESEEGLEAGRMPSTAFKPMTSSVITPPQKISAIRPTLGIRERRNSFRQAVCKEDNPPPYRQTELGKKINGSLGGMQNTGMPPRSHKDYEPIWPDQGNRGYHHIDSGYAQENDNGRPSMRSRKYEPDKVSQYQRIQRQRSHSEERSLDSSYSHNINPEGQSAIQHRFDEIQLLLDELKAPNAISQSKAICTEAESDAKSAQGIKYHRSLRSPSRPQPPNGLSCFTFARKPGSLESISDAFQYGLKTETVPLIQQNGVCSNEYMPLFGNRSRQNEQPSQIKPTGASSSEYAGTHLQKRIPRMELHKPPQFNSNGVPIAPPRSKKLQKSHTISIPNGITRVRDPSSKLMPGWPDSHRDIHNLPEVVRCTRGDEAPVLYNHEQSSSSGNPSSSTAPNHIIKALGIFQAKAANMRSKLSTWGENREKRNAEKDAMRDEMDGGFTSKAGSSFIHHTHPSSNRLTTRQQYL